QVKGVAQCAAMHPDPVLDESVIINDNGTLKNVIVSVSAGLPAGQNFPPPATPAVINQEGCLYSPHVLPMMTGQTLKVLNSDTFLHNIHSLSQENPSFNNAQPNKDLNGMPTTS